MSLESDSEKNTPMNTIQIQRNSSGSNAPGAARRRHPDPNTRSAGSVHGTLPAKNTPAKNHHGFLPIGDGGQEPRHVLVHEEELQEIRQSPRGEPVPGHGDREKQRQAPLQVQPAPRPEVARISAVQNQARPREWPQRPDPWSARRSPPPPTPAASKGGAAPPFAPAKKPPSSTSCRTSGSCPASAADPGPRTSTCRTSTAAARQAAAGLHSRRAVSHTSTIVASAVERAIQTGGERRSDRTIDNSMPSPSIAAAVSRYRPSRSSAE